MTEPTPLPTVVPTADAASSAVVHVGGQLARDVALDLVRAVLIERRPLDEALASHARLAEMPTRDRGFARILVATLLRRLGQVDRALAGCLRDPLEDVELVTRDILRLGAVQLLFLSTPAHAAVDGAVRQTEQRQPRLKGLVNAVLRRLSREGAAMVAAQDPARDNLPDWLWQSWTASYGEATARGIGAAWLRDPPLDLTLRDPDPAALADWAARLGGRILPTGSLRLDEAGPIAELEGYEAGAWWVQDTAASLPARLLGPLAGRRVVELCAAPGGKTAQLAAAGAEVTAIDRKPRRLERLRANLARLGLTAEVVAADAKSWNPGRRFDAALLDAPCSATGTLRRHPDIAHLKRAEDLPGLIVLQDALLANAIALTEPGGLVVFCTCSLEPAEGPARIAARLAQGGVERVPITSAEITGAGAGADGEAAAELAAAITPEGDLRTTPALLARAGGMDGFFAARLRKLG